MNLIEAWVNELKDSNLDTLHDNLVKKAIDAIYGSKFPEKLSERNKENIIKTIHKRIKNGMYGNITYQAVEKGLGRYLAARADTRARETLVSMGSPTSKTPTSDTVSGVGSGGLAIPDMNEKKQNKRKTAAEQFKQLEEYSSILTRLGEGKTKISDLDKSLIQDMSDKGFLSLKDGKIVGDRIALNNHARNLAGKKWLDTLNTQAYENYDAYETLGGLIDHLHEKHGGLAIAGKTRKDSTTFSRILSTQLGLPEGQWFPEFVGDKKAISRADVFRVMDTFQSGLAGIIGNTKGGRSIRAEKAKNILREIEQHGWDLIPAAKQSIKGIEQVAFTPKTSLKTQVPEKEKAATPSTTLVQPKEELISKVGSFTGDERQAVPATKELPDELTLPAKQRAEGRRLIAQVEAERRQNDVYNPQTRNSTIGVIPRDVHVFQTLLGAGIPADVAHRMTKGPRK